MRIFILILSLILVAIATYAGHWAVSASSIVLLVFLILIWGLSERLILRSFYKITNLQETNFHHIEKQIQVQLKEKGFEKINIWSTEDNKNFQFYAFGTSKNSHLIFTNSLLSELSSSEVTNLSGFAGDLIEKRFLKRQLLWSSIIIAVNKPLKAFDRAIAFFSGLKSENGEPRHILRSLNSWIILTLRSLNRNKVGDSFLKKKARETLKNYSYIQFHHTSKPLRPISVVDYALK